MTAMLTRRLAGVALALALSTTCPSAQEAGVRDRPFLTVQGQGKVSARPDVARLAAVVSTRVTGRDATLDVASKRHAPKAKGAAEVLSGRAKQGVGVRESAFTMVVEQPPVILRDGKDGKDERQAVVAMTRFDIEVKPVDGLDAAVSALAASGLFEVQNVSYEVADQKGQLDAARRSAMADALSQGRLYSEAGGFRVVEIVAVQDGQARVMDHAAPGIYAMRSAGAPAPMQAAAPATIDTEASVSVTWRIAGRPEGTVP